MSKAEGLPAHQYPSTVCVLQYRNIYKKFQVLETNPHNLIFRPEPRKNQQHHSPKEISDPRTFDYPPKADHETPPAPNRQNQSKHKQKKKQKVAENNPTSAAAAARVRTATLPEVSQKR